MTDSVSIIGVETPEDLAHIRALFLEYQKWLGIDLCFQNFEEELETLPGRYAPPGGCLLLGRLPEEPREVVGGVGLRPLEDDICEMKRLYVRPGFRGRGFGRRLAEAVVEKARRAGYKSMRLDTLRRLEEALELYRSMGFVEIPAYCQNPHENVAYLELPLKD